MITVFDMETGEILERRGQPVVLPEQPVSNPARWERIPEPALREHPADREPGLRIPPDLAALDMAEVLARFQGA